MLKSSGRFASFPPLFWNVPKAWQARVTEKLGCKAGFVSKLAVKLR
jgi:hypothetical protein